MQRWLRPRPVPKVRKGLVRARKLLRHAGGEVGQGEEIVPGRREGGRTRLPPPARASTPGQLLAVVPGPELRDRGTPDLNAIVNFLDASEHSRSEFEELQRIEWHRMHDQGDQQEATQELSSVAEQRDETALYEGVGPHRYARYLNWKQTPHSAFVDEAGRLRSVLEDARGEALPSSPTEHDELCEILGTAGYEIWRNLPSPTRAGTQSGEPQP